MSCAISIYWKLQFRLLSRIWPKVQCLHSVRPDFFLHELSLLGNGSHFGKRRVRSFVWLPNELATVQPFAAFPLVGCGLGAEL